MRVWWILSLFFMGCTETTEPISGEFSHCDPLDANLCVLPYPSSFYQTKADTVSGMQNAFPTEALPQAIDGTPIDPDAWNALDGFSVLTPLLVHFPGVSLDGVMGHEHLEDYTSDTVRTVIINTETGDRVPHFAELDMSAPEEERLLIIRPVSPMDHGVRHVVGIRNLVDTAGTPLTASAAFTKLRDNVSTTNWDVEGRRDHFESSVFPVLETEGFTRSELLLAWDFTTVSQESTLGRVHWMRDDVLERIGEDGPEYTIDSIEDGNCDGGATIGRTILGHMTVPLYTEEDEPGTVLTQDENGMPYYNGDKQAPFLVRIPCTLMEDPRPGRILQYGHGLLGTYDEARSGYLGEMANEFGWVILAQHWTGMSQWDSGYISLMLVTDLSDFRFIPERTMQGYVEKVAGLRMLMGAFSEDPEVTFDGVSVIDPDKVSYFGNSQGAIVGSGYVAISPDLERAVLGVGGTPYSLLLSRSNDFTPFFSLFQARYYDARDIAFLIAFVQTVWDPAEVSGYAHAMNRQPLPNTPAKDVILPIAIGDTQVSSLGSHIMARAFGASTVAPETRSVWGIDEKEPGFEGSAIVEWLYTDVGAEPVENLPPPGPDPHECPRREWAAHEQMYDFFETGVVNQYCDGICDGLVSETCP